MANKEFILGRLDLLSEVAGAALDTSRVTGLTHNFYRYPARFSPKLVRTLIHTFTEPGDLILDPFVGGGTTLVEALATGRDAIGVDISSLATFVSEVKTTIYTEKELVRLSRWCKTATANISPWCFPEYEPYFENAGYLRHLDTADNWRLKNVIGQIIVSASKLKPKRLEGFARCVLLRTAQWALNGRKKLPSVDEFRTKLMADGIAMIAGARELCEAAISHQERKVSITCLHRASGSLEEDPFFKDGRKPRLIVTSPPYPGVHVLYHRWQVDGRKETAAPFWIANRLDGNGDSYYTMGGRTKELNGYFSNLRDSLRSVSALCDRYTMVVQVVAFSEPEWQLPRYLSIADDVGLDELVLPVGDLGPDGRLWRRVPGRRWYANQRGPTAGSREVVLFHRRRADWR